VNPVFAVRWAGTLLPALLVLFVILTPVAGYELQEILVVALLFSLYMGALLLRSEGLHFFAFVGLATLIVVGMSQGSYLYSLTAVVGLLIALDFVGLVHSLFGLTLWRGSPSTWRASSKYLGIVADHLVRSAVVGACTLLLSLAILSVPLPQLAFGNPVSGTGILALASLFLILLAFSKPGQVRKWFQGRRPDPSTGV